MRLGRSTARGARHRAAGGEKKGWGGKGRATTHVPRLPLHLLARLVHPPYHIGRTDSLSIHYRRVCSAVY